MQKLRETGVALIISHHDFNATKDLDGIYKRIVPFHPDFIKIVPTAKTLFDNVTLMRFIERMDDRSNIIGICMGDAGIISRVLGLRAGSAFTFAAATPGRRDGARADCCAHVDRDLPDRPGRRGNEGLRRRRQSDQELALADHDEHGVPARDRQRSVSRAAGDQGDRPAETGA